jgi:hypothetical protein
MEKVLVTLFILLSFSLVFANEQEKKEPKVFTDGDLNKYRSPIDSSSKDNKSSFPSEEQKPCSGENKKFKECYDMRDADKRHDCIDYWFKKGHECVEDYLYGPPVRVRIIPR